MDLGANGRWSKGSWKTAGRVLWVVSMTPWEEWGTVNRRRGEGWPRYEVKEEGKNGSGWDGVIEQRMWDI